MSNNKMAEDLHRIWWDYYTTYNYNCNCNFCKYVKKYRNNGGFTMMTFRPQMIVSFGSKLHGPHEKYPGEKYKDLYTKTSYIIN